MELFTMQKPDYRWLPIASQDGRKLSCEVEAVAWQEPSALKAEVIEVSCGV